MTQQSTASEAVISRIRKLMALTTDAGATEAEAALAASHVQRILAEHNLSMAAVEASGGATNSEGGKRERTAVNKRQVYSWQRHLMKTVAEVNYCVALARFKVGRGQKIFDGYDLIGRVDNVTTVSLMFEYLLEAIERLARNFVGNDPARYFTREAHSFKEGCAYRLHERLEEQFKALLEEQAKKEREEKARSSHPGAAPGTGLVLYLGDVVQREKDLNNDLIKGLEPGTTARNRERHAAEARAASDRRQAIYDANVGPHGHEVATYMSYGYSLDRAQEFARQQSEPSKPETEAQKRKRLEREKKAEKRAAEQWRRREQREANRLDQNAYWSGHEAGDEVSLNRQIDEDCKKRIGK